MNAATSCRLLFLPRPHCRLPCLPRACSPCRHSSGGISTREPCLAAVIQQVLPSLNFYLGCVNNAFVLLWPSFSTVCSSAGRMRWLQGAQPTVTTPSWHDLEKNWLLVFGIFLYKICVHLISSIHSSGRNFKESNFPDFGELWSLGEHLLILGLSALLVMNTHQMVVVGNDNDCRIRILGIPSGISNGLNERCAFLNNI